MAQEFGFGNIVFEAQQRAFEAARLAGQHFVFHIRLAASVVTDQYSGQMWASPSGCHHLFYLLLDFAFNRGGCSLSVYQLHISDY